MDFDHCPCSGKHLGRLIQPAVMASLAGEPLHGYRLAQRLGQMRMFADAPPDPTGVYRVLKAMEGEGLLESSWDLAESGPAKRLYTLTPRGIQCMKRWRESLEAYGKSVADLLRAMSRAGEGDGAGSGAGRDRPCGCAPRSKIARRKSRPTSRE